MSCGLPCVVSTHGHGGLIRDGHTGLTVDPSSVEAIGVAIRRVLTHQAWAGQLGDTARAEVLAHYDLWSLMAEEMRILQAVAGNSFMPLSPLPVQSLP